MQNSANTFIYSPSSYSEDDSLHMFQGAFLIGKDANYRAILETALDIAKGMLQLHKLDLVHSDLKVRTSHRNG